MDPVTVCNMALGLFGGNRIVSIEESAIGDSAEAALCFTYFRPSYLEVLEDGAWLFASEFINLGSREDSPYLSLGQTPLPGNRPLTAQFTLPGTVVRVIACDDGSGDFAIAWKRNGRKVLSEETDVLLAEVIKEVQNTDEWTPGFTWSVAYKLASKICGPITQSFAKTKEMRETYKEEVAHALNKDGMQGATTQRFKARSESLARRR